MNAATKPDPAEVPLDDIPVTYEPFEGGKHWEGICRCRQCRKPTPPKLTGQQFARAAAAGVLKNAAWFVACVRHGEPSEATADAVKLKQTEDWLERVAKWLAEGAGYSGPTP